MYATTITKSNQITINSEARQALGVKSGEKLDVVYQNGSLVIRRHPSDAEFFEQLDSLKSEKTKQNVKKYAGYDMSDFRSLPGYHKELKEEYAH